MAKGVQSAILPQIQRIFHVVTLASAGDGELLARFTVRGDEAAFETLLARHGPLVLGVCRSLLRDPADAEDAFQATILVLVRKAGSIRLDDSLGPWIYGVATRVARRARATAARRAIRERAGMDAEPESPGRDLDRHDVAPILHEELARLPDRLRAPLVLCYLEGLTHELAAQRLGCPVGTVRSRLARGRDRLRDRLSRRGIALSGGISATVFGEAIVGPIPQALAESTLRAAMRVAAGRTVTAGAVSAPVAALMEGVLYAMKLTKLRAAAAALIVAGFLATGLAVRAEKEADDLTADAGQVRSPALAGDNRPIGPDGRPVGPLNSVQRRGRRPAADGGSHATITKTYYVGDLILRPASSTRGAGRVDMEPLIELIASTVAPGTWKFKDLSDESALKGNIQRLQSVNPTGSMTPFYQSLSLIVRHRPEVHDEMANRIRQIRRLMLPPEVDAEPQATAQTRAPIAIAPAVAGGDVSDERFRKLLRELEREFENVCRNRDVKSRLGETRTAPVQ